MASANRPISTVLSDIAGNIQEIIRSELRLAKTEVTESLGKARPAGVLLGVGALMVFCSALFVLLAIVYALSAVVPEWAAALIVGVGAGALAALCLGAGIKMLTAIRAAPKTSATVKETVEWARQATK
jgi:drug/metabolite transporter (DMT)-like permease